MVFAVCFIFDDFSPFPAPTHTVQKLRVLMAFVPREEYVPRRGVAMKIQELPSPRLRRGIHRDEFVDQVADSFSKQPFVMNRALDASHQKISKVKTFKSGEIFAATGNGNVIAPIPAAAVVKRHRPPPDDAQLALLYQSPEAARHRMNEQTMMEEGKGVFEKMTQPPALRRHRLPGLYHDGEAKEAAKPVMGFFGLGSHVIDRAAGKAKVATHVYDPLGFNRFCAPERIHGLKRMPSSLESQLGEVIKHDDGVPLCYQSSPLRAHRRQPPPVTFPSPECDIPGFTALGASDEPAKPTGTKMSVSQQVDHDYRSATSLAHTAPSPGGQLHPLHRTPDPSVARSMPVPSRYA